MSDEPKADNPIASLGGKASAAKLSAAERKERARQAATARWHGNVLKATHGSPDQPLVIGDIEIPCYVLENGTRVVVQTGMIRALGMKKGGSSHTGGTRLAKFVSGDRIKQFVTKELIERTQNPIRFITPSGTMAFGFDAEILAEICEAVLEANKKGILQQQQKAIAEQCWILYRGIARVGIVALIDEATGYQYDRARGELQRLLEQYVSKELARWERTFEVDFYRHMHRLKGWKFDPNSTKRTHAVARLTVNLTYDRIHPDLLRELKQVRGDSKKPNSKLFQWLTSGPTGGHPRLKQHLEGVTALMSVAKDWDQFEYWIDQRYPRLNQTLRIPFPEPKEDEPQGKQKAK